MLKVLRAGGEEPRQPEVPNIYYLYALKQLGGSAYVDQMRAYVRRSFNCSEPGARAFLKIQQLRKGGFIQVCIESRRTRSRRNRHYKITAAGEEKIAGNNGRFLRAGEQAIEDASRRRY